MSISGLSGVSAATLLQQPRSQAASGHVVPITLTRVAEPRQCRPPGWVTYP